MDHSELKEFIRDLIIEEFSPRPVELAQKWQGGKIILEPGGDSQAKEVPMDVFLRKRIGVRDSLRVLEQKLNSSKSLTAEEKASFHSYITKAYGSLTTFNILLRMEKISLWGLVVREVDRAQKMTMTEAKAKLGLNEY